MKKTVDGIKNGTDLNNSLKQSGPELDLCRPIMKATVSIGDSKIIKPNLYSLVCL